MPNQNISHSKPTMAVLQFLVLLLFTACARSCSNATFEGTFFTALKNVKLDGEITDYNFFSKAKTAELASIHHITGCITPVDELEDAVAIQIRGERVPIFYEGAVQNLPYLHSLHIVTSEVYVLKPRAFVNLPSLKVIKIQDNPLESIPPNVFNQLLITRLILSSNNISHIAPDAFDDMEHLESVNLAGNKLSQWNLEWFNNCPKIQFLSLKFNHIVTIPARAFRNMEEALQRLYLSYNRIKEINPKAFTGLTELTDLSLSQNNISTLDDNTFLYLSKLKMIDLSETSISCLSEHLLNSLKTDVLLWIDQTPFNETCLPILEEWAQINRNELMFYKSLVTTTLKPSTTKIF